jgi:glyoxylase-like metal-dependent hydrolase (beta-lactamase superfamily II)
VGGRIAIGERVRVVQEVFGRLFNAGDEFARDGSQFDRLLADGEAFFIGGHQVRAIHTPGHTPACMTYVMQTDEQTVAFVGDTLFMPDYGTARCDFPGGDARTLFRSIQRVLSLPPRRPCCICVTTTRLAGAPSGSSRRWPMNGPATSMSARASAKTSSSP